MIALFKRGYVAMTVIVLCMGVLLSPSLAGAQDKSGPEEERLKPIPEDQMTPAQKLMVEHMKGGERKGNPGRADSPFVPSMRDPEVGDLAQEMGNDLKFHSAIPDKLNELAILMTARFWSGQYSWSQHHGAALKAGIAPETIAAIQMGKRPTNMPPDEEMVFNFGDELLKTKQVSDPVYKAVLDKFGERGVVDLTSIMGYYSFVCMMLDVDRYPVAEGKKPELKPLP